MSTPPTLPDWCQVGATGAAYNPRFSRPVVFATIEKITPSQVVTGAYRFNRATLRGTGRDADWQLLPLNDCRVVNAYARDQFADLANQSHDLHRNLPPTAAAERPGRFRSRDPENALGDCLAGPSG